uniref:Reverse transcriptase domain-containing protein n=1 Tax=Fagus sylvatica TaxID=28930 RepID=A0A2N9I574_FAGSY
MLLVVWAKHERKGVRFLETSPPLVVDEGMGDRCSFRIESKRFDLVWVNDGTKQVRISEKGSYHRSIVYMGKEGVRWLGRCMEENIVREGEKAFIRTLETEKVKDSTKAVLVNAIPEVEGKVDSNLGATVTTKSMERIMPRQFFPEAAPVIPPKGNPKLGKQWVPHDKHEDTTNTQQVGPVFINGPSESRVTKGFGPRSTYEAGESSGSKKQQNGPNDEIRDSMGSEGSRNRNGSNLVDNGPSTLAYSSHGLPNLHLKESRAFLTGRGAYQIRVDWHLVEALIYTNRGMISEVPVKCKFAFDLLSQRSLRLIARETISLQLAREAEEILVTVHDPLALVPSSSQTLAREPREDSDVLDISPIRTYWTYQESEGASGGILIMWDRRVVEVLNCVKVGRACRGVLEGILMWSDFRVRSWGWVGIWGAMQKFSEFIFELGLVDLPLLEGQFTWSNNQDLPAKSRIDRFLVSNDWEEQFSQLMQKALLHFVSDHCPIILECRNFKRGKSYFKFENMWLHHQDFVGNVRNLWGGYDFQGSPSDILASKLKVLKEDIKKWNKECFGDVRIKKLDLMHELQMLEGKENQGLLTAEEKSYRLKGDKNTKFFQRTANAHRQNNYIESLQHREQQWKSESEIRDRIVDFYQGLYSEREAWRPVLGGVEFNTIDSAEATQLEGPFSEEEVVTALNQMNGEKAPGPDGYTIAFYKHCWDIVKLEVLNSLQEFHEHESIKRNLNATFVALIPKKPGVSDVKDFRPICLIGSVYKIRSKILANCLKAYDHVNWNFLMYMLEWCSFGAKWRNWMYFCMSTVRFLILINGTPCGFFNSTRGIRQGDSLSPLLFVLVMEALSRLMDKAVSEILLEGFALLHLKGVLTCFEAVSSLHINLGKSEIVPVGMVHGIHDLAQVIGGQITTLPMKYLGLPLGARYKSKEIWNPILEKMERHLAGWKRLYLSKGENTALWRQVIASKYGVGKGDWYTKEDRGGHGVCLWKHIRLGASTSANQMRWDHTGSGLFEVRSFYHIICAGGESMDHLLLHCDYASELWSFIFCIVGLQWVMPCKVSELLACWRRRDVSSKNVIWNAIPSCLMWLIWRERNMRAFEDSERHSMELKLTFLHTMVEWMAAMSSQPALSMLHFIDGCL